MEFPPQLVLHRHPFIRSFIHYKSSLNISLCLVAFGDTVFKKLPQDATNAGFPRQSSMAPVPFVWIQCKKGLKLISRFAMPEPAIEIIKSSNLEV